MVLISFIIDRLIVSCSFYLDIFNKCTSKATFVCWVFSVQAHSWWFCLPNWRTCSKTLFTSTSSSRASWPSWPAILSLSYAPSCSTPTWSSSPVSNLWSRYASNESQLIKARRPWVSKYSTLFKEKVSLRISRTSIILLPLLPSGFRFCEEPHRGLCGLSWRLSSHAEESAAVPGGSRQSGLDWHPCSGPPPAPLWFPQWVSNTNLNHIRTGHVSSLISVVWSTVRTESCKSTWFKFYWGEGNVTKFISL